MNMKYEDSFQTSDLSLATFLYSKGILLHAILDTPGDYQRKVFVFSSPPTELIRSFQSGEAVINVLAFTAAQNTLKGMLRKR